MRLVLIILCTCLYIWISCWSVVFGIVHDGRLLGGWGGPGGQESERKKGIEGCLRGLAHPPSWTAHRNFDGEGYRKLLGVRPNKILKEGGGRSLPQCSPNLLPIDCSEEWNKPEVSSPPLCQFDRTCETHPSKMGTQIEKEEKIVFCLIF
jgi:hypothetical protein